jgi:hypothetical protein
MFHLHDFVDHLKTPELPRLHLPECVQLSLCCACWQVQMWIKVRLSGGIVMPVNRMLMIGRTLPVLLPVRCACGCCRGTPGKLLGLGLLLVLAAAGAVVVIPDNSSNDVILQAALAGALGITGVVALIGGGFVSDLQK